MIGDVSLDTCKRIFVIYVKWVIFCLLFEEAHHIYVSIMLQLFHCRNVLTDYFKKNKQCFEYLLLLEKEQIGDTVYIMRIVAGCTYRYNF